MHLIKDKRFTTTLLLLVLVLILFNFNFDVLTTEAQMPKIVGEGAPGYLAKWIGQTTSPPSVSNVTITEPNYCVSGPMATVNWTYSDPQSSAQSAYQVQIDDISSFNSPEWDSGKVLSSSISNSTPQGLLQFSTTYKARVRVWNSFDIISSWTQSNTWKTPNNAFPQVNFTWSPANPQTSQPIQFTDQTQFFDSNSNGRSWSWVFGDGGSSTLVNPIKTYSQVGIYNVTLTATDTQNQSCSITKSVNIQVPNPIWKEINPGG